MKLVHIFISALILLAPVNTATSQAIEPKPESRIGLGIFALLDPKFPVNDAIELLRSYKKPAFSFTYDGFGRSNRNYKAVMSHVSGAKVSIYGLCGPCRFPRRSGMETFLPGLSIPAFNRALLNKPTQEKFRQLLITIKQKFVDPYPHNKFVFYPELESNFNNEVVGITYNIAVEVFADSPNVEIKLNPLKLNRIAEIPIEVHSINLFSSLTTGDSISLDGVGITPPSTKLTAAIKLAHKKSIDFALWDFSWQGLIKGRSSAPLPKYRKYTFPNKSYIKYLLKLY